jgi:hypothetical protein
VTPEELRVSRSKFLDFLNQPGVFRILRAKSCLCGPCNEHGTLNFEELAALLQKLGGYVGSTVAAALKLRADKLHGYLAHEFRPAVQSMQPVSDCRIKVALRVSKASVSPRLALAVTAEGVKATIDVTVDVPGRTRLALNVQRALAPVKAYGLQRIASSPMPASPRPRRSTRPVIARSGC